jgi:hypothetical protein
MRPQFGEEIRVKRARRNAQPTHSHHVAHPALVLRIFGVIGGIASPPARLYQYSSGAARGTVWCRVGGIQAQRLGFLGRQTGSGKVAETWETVQGRAPPRLPRSCQGPRRCPAAFSGTRQSPSASFARIRTAYPRRLPRPVNSSCLSMGKYPSWDSAVLSFTSAASRRAA